MPRRKLPVSAQIAASAIGHASSVKGKRTLCDSRRPGVSRPGLLSPPYRTPPPIGDNWMNNRTRFMEPMTNEMQSAATGSPASSTSSDRATSVMNEGPDQLLFSSGGYRNTFKEDLKAINKQHRDVYNRLHSISEDSEFVTKMVGQYQPLPVIGKYLTCKKKVDTSVCGEYCLLNTIIVQILRACFSSSSANLRCGAWYIDPHDTKASCTAYFKSTDVAIFSAKIKPQLLHVIISSGGVILVDSTRRGKRFPDALSKTVPSWCAVINAARAKLLDRHPIAPELRSAWEPHSCSLGLTTPANAVRSSEHDQIQRLVDAWADQLLASSFNIESTLAQLHRPLKPIWVSPASHFGKDPIGDVNGLDFHPVICLSASKYLGDQASLDRTGGFSYIQGAGDDHEGWSRGLTPKLFWENRFQLLSANRSELECLIDQIVSSSLDNTFSNLKLVEIFEVRSTKLFIHLPSDLYKNLPSEDELDVIISGGDSVELKCKKHKINKTVAMGHTRNMKDLATTLSSILPECTEMIQHNRAVRLTAIGPKLDQAKELMVAIALCLLVNVFGDQGLHRDEPPKKIDKADIRDRLYWIIEASEGTINPPRSILKKVNSYLIV
ncbi:hypothetical protein PSHT_08749 [Puccinia striiformis]|uniref:Initiator tRNA phosphoribosyl transferase n=1 Tax=Puccinia striiformis TaxID=27350 RepID=A0A2S4VLS5_9BASI|nr:hypothetical protein PSHT_08749 [Puccinia striiformis]